MASPALMRRMNGSVIEYSASFKYWRFTVTKTAAGTDTFKIGIAEIELANEATPVSMAGAYTASSSAPGTTPDPAFDGLVATQWVTSPGATPPQWIMANLTTPSAATSVKITSGNDASRAKRAPSAFTVEGSNDGLSFDLIATFSSIPAWGITEERTFNF